MVHPHACGELIPAAFCGVLPSGSSPRMWGTRRRDAFPSSCPWFIPTHVGNSHHTGTLHLCTTVHPHACGELISPLLIPVIFIRFIPTHVGNSVKCCWCGICHTVHPHACGELISPSSSRGNQVGSSPRMWGTQRFRHDGEMSPWFIPTHVGNSFANPITITVDLVHPHACGELE